MAKTLLYARVSTGNQTTGLEAQVLALKKYCDSHGIKDYEIFADENVSGAKASRPALDKLMIEVQSGKATTVITYSLSRLSRSTAHLLKTLEQFREQKVEFISVTEAISLSSPAGRMMVTVLGAVAELERALVIERTKCGLENARAKGKKLGAPKKFSNQDLLLQLSGQNLSQRQIAKLMGCSVATVSRELKKVTERVVA